MDSTVSTNTENSVLENPDSVLQPSNTILPDADHKEPAEKLLTPNLTNEVPKDVIEDSETFETPNSNVNEEVTVVSEKEIKPELTEKPLTEEVIDTSDVGEHSQVILDPSNLALSQSSDSIILIQTTLAGDLIKHMINDNNELDAQYVYEATDVFVATENTEDNNDNNITESEVMLCDKNKNDLQLCDEKESSENPVEINEISDTETSQEINSLTEVHLNVENIVPSQQALQENKTHVNIAEEIASEWSFSDDEQVQSKHTSESHKSNITTESNDNVNPEEKSVERFETIETTDENVELDTNSQLNMKVEMDESHNTQTLITEDLNNINDNNENDVENYEIESNEQDENNKSETVSNDIKINIKTDEVIETILDQHSVSESKTYSVEVNTADLMYGENIIVNNQTEFEVCDVKEIIVSNIDVKEEINEKQNTERNKNTQIVILKNELIPSSSIFNSSTIEILEITNNDICIENVPDINKISEDESSKNEMQVDEIKDESNKNEEKTSKVKPNTNRSRGRPKSGTRQHPLEYLTSHIASKDEIKKEVAHRKTLQNPDVPAVNDKFFAKKLLSRLAKKILTSDEKNESGLTKEANEGSSETKENISDQLKLLDGDDNEGKKPDLKIEKNKETLVSDQELLAILEGEGNDNKTHDLSPPVLTPENKDTPTNTSIENSPPKLEVPSVVSSNQTKRKKIVVEAPPNLDPETIRQIALQQLKELPFLGKKKKGPKPKNEFKGKFPKKRGTRRRKVKGKVQQTDFVIDPNDPFAFDENSRTVEETPPKKFERFVPRIIKTYSKKNDQSEPEADEIIIPKEILEMEISQNEEEKDKIVENEENQSAEGSSQDTVNEETINKSKKDEKKTKKSIKKIEDNLQKNEKESNQVDKEKETADMVSDTENIVKTATKKSKSTKPEKAISLPHPETKFVLMSKRARPIKRKIIWDPDAIQTYRNVKHLPKPKETTTKTETKDSEKQALTEVKKPLKQLEIKKSKKTLLLTKTKIKTAGRTLLKRLANGKVVKKTVITSNSDSLQKKKQIKPKRNSELDRLLMDEGALNMLYSVKQDVDTPIIKQNQRVISMDKFKRDMNKKKKAILSVLETTPESSPKVLRKKESPIVSTVPSTSSLLSRKKSGDSTRSFVHSPPPSPGAMFPPRAEASRIIRRHSSSSSFSSECMSPRRLSTTDVEIKLKEGNEDKAEEKNTDKSQKNLEKADVKSVEPEIKKKRGIPIYIRQKEQKTYKGKRNRVVPLNSQDKNTNESEKKVNQQTSEVSTEKRKLNDDSSSKETKKVKKSKLDDPKDDNEKETKGQKNIKKATSPEVEAYLNVIKTFDSDSQKKVDEKHRTSTRQNAGTYNYKEISLRKLDSLVQIIFTPTSAKIKNSFNIQVMRELCDALNTLKRDGNCRAVLLTSTGNVFCQGIDYSSLIQQTSDKRKTSAQEMANSVKELIKTIATFPRTLIAGIQGTVCDLGVALLPLCDLVFVSDKATFSTQYAKLGCLPEGAATVSLPHVTSQAVTCELLLAGHKMTAAEALRHGLASRVLWPDNFQQELIPICKAIAAQSSQSMDATKQVLRHALITKIEAALESETNILIQHWTSAECQQSFKTALDQNEW